MIIQLRLESQLSEAIQHPESVLRRAADLGAKYGAERYTELVLDYIASGRSFRPRHGGSGLEGSISWRSAGPGQADVTANKAYAPFIEYGTRPHIIGPRPGRLALQFPGPGGGFIVRRRVMHPGGRPYPFFFADFEARRASVIESMRLGVAQVLSGEVR